MTFKEKIAQLKKHHAKLPMPKEYIQLLNRYTEEIYKWMPHINNMIYYHESDAADEMKGKATAASMRLLHDMKFYLENICEIRTYMLLTSSMLIMIGFNYPTEKALHKFEKLLDIYEEAMLDNMVILQKYKYAINNHKRLCINKCKVPISMDDVEKLDCWPYNEAMTGFAEHGAKMLDLVEQRPKK